jgi:hypothetical protein
MSDTFSNSPRFPGSENDPDRPPRRRWSPVTVGLAAVVAVAGLVGVLVVFGDPMTRALFLTLWLGLTYFVVMHYDPRPPDDESPSPRDDR